MTQPLTERQKEILRVFFDIWDRKTPDEKQQIVRDAIPRATQELIDAKSGRKDE